MVFLHVSPPNHTLCYQDARPTMNNVWNIAIWHHYIGHFGKRLIKNKYHEKLKNIPNKSWLLICPEINTNINILRTHIFFLASIVDQ